MFPILNPPPSSPPVPSLWVVPEHQPQASSIMHRTWTGSQLACYETICSKGVDMKILRTLLIALPWTSYLVSLKFLLLIFVRTTIYKQIHPKSKYLLNIKHTVSASSSYIAVMTRTFIFLNALELELSLNT